MGGCLMGPSWPPCTVAVAKVEDPAVEPGTPVIWAVEPETTVVAEVPAGEGGGKVLFCQLGLPSHVVRDGEWPDPVAQRIFSNLLGW